MSNSGMRPIHPGEILKKEFLEPLGITAAGLASLLNEGASEVSAVVMQGSGISPELAKKLSLYLKPRPSSG